MQDARQLLREGRAAEAAQAARRAYDPADPESRLILGLALGLSGDAEEGAQHLAAALTSGQGNPRHWHVLAAARGQLGDWKGEAAALSEAVALAPTDASLRLLLAGALIDSGEWEAALESSIAALAVQESTDAHQLFCEAVRGSDRTDPPVRALLARALAEAWASYRKVSGPALRVVKALGLPAETDELLGELLTNGPLADTDLERELSVLRRRYFLAGGGPPDFLRRLAAQGYINEFCWPVAEDEAEAVAALAPGDPLRALYSETEAEPDPPDFPTLTPTREGVSADVRAMYEANPYPRYVRVPEQEPRPLPWVLRSTFPRAQLAEIPGSEMLVAGCGTGQHAIQVAKRYEGAHVLAVDLSRASLGYAIRKSAEAGVANVTYGQADLLDLPALGRRFDAISCAGTLQAMADPLEGFRALLAMLKPGGVIHLGLYSRTARAELAPAMALAKRFPPTREGIRALRLAIMEAPAGDPVRAPLDWGDFCSASMVRDLLMHVMEHQHDIADIRGMLQLGGLRLLGFMLPPETLAAYRRANPMDPAATDLACWEAFEAANPRTFRGMYQFWAQLPASPTP